MKPLTTTLTLALALAATIAGCSTNERSRSLSDPAVPAKTIAQQVCSNCHGVDGNATSPNFPRLAGQPETYLITQLNGFKSHSRSDPAGFEYMWGLSRRLSDDQIIGLAAYFAAQAPAANKSGDPKLISEGKEVYDKGVASKNIPACVTCHGAQGQGSGTFPRLASQHADYMVKQLQVFQRTDERPAGSVMKQIAHALTPRDMLAVATYLQALTSN